MGEILYVLNEENIRQTLNSRKQTPLSTVDHHFLLPQDSNLPSVDLILRPTHPGEHKWVKVHLLLTQRGPWQWQVRQSETSNDTLCQFAVSVR